MADRNKRRDVPRRSASVTAVIHFRGVDRLCIVENRSPKGFLLNVGPELPPLESFQLLVPDEDPVTVTTMWRSGNRLGARTGAPTPLRRLNRLVCRLGLAR